MLCDEYSLNSWWDFTGVNGITLFMIARISLVINNMIIAVFIICLLDICCWFGDVAVK